MVLLNEVIFEFNKAAILVGMILLDRIRGCVGGRLKWSWGKVGGRGGLVEKMGIICFV